MFAPLWFRLKTLMIPIKYFDLWLTVVYWCRLKCRNWDMWIMQNLGSQFKCCTLDANHKYEYWRHSWFHFRFCFRSKTDFQVVDLIRWPACKHYMCDVEWTKKLQRIINLIGTNLMFASKKREMFVCAYVNRRGDKVNVNEIAQSNKLWETKRILGMSDASKTYDDDYHCGHK